MSEFQFNTIDEILEDLRDGKIVVMIDDEDRENEGDVICAAEHATLENVNFMASYAKGLICMPMDESYTKKLGLRQMCEVNTDNHCTAFTVSIDHKDTTTGISAYERSITAMKTVDPDAKPGDFRMPGHMFPLQAKKGGVLERNGHTEATVDLMRIAAGGFVLRDYERGWHDGTYAGSGRICKETFIEVWSNCRSGAVP